jgi:hypothetical protein
MAKDIITITTKDISDILQDVSETFDRSNTKHGPFVSVHDGLGVLREEYLELEKEVFWGHDKSKIRAEAIDVAAMAVKLVDSLSVLSPK